MATTAALRCPEPDAADPSRPCPETFEQSGLLAAHLATTHLVNGSDAFRRARAVAEAPGREANGARLSSPSRAVDRATPPPARTDTGAPDTPPDPTPSAQPAASGISAGPGRGTAGATTKEDAVAKPCTRCKRSDGTHTETCHGRPENRIARCKLCAKVAPDRCKWHGGPSHSTSGPNKAALRGKKRAAPPATTAGLSGHLTVPKTYAPAGKAANGRPAPKAGKSSGLPSFVAALTFLDTQIEAAEARLAKLKAARDGMAMLVEATSA